MLIRSLFICSLGFSSQILGLTVGSDSAVSIAGFTEFPQSENNTNELLGFSAFTGGWGLENSQTTCTVNNFYPNKLFIDIRGGTLNLKEDLFIAGSGQILTGGKIDAGGHAIVFREMKNEAYLEYQFPQCYGNKFAFRTTGPVKGFPICSIDWTSDDNYFLTAYFVGRIYIQSYNSGWGNYTNKTFTAAINDARWHPGDYYLALGFAQSALDELQIGLYNTGPKTLTWPQTINEGTTIHGLDWSSNGSYLLVSREDDPRLKVFSFNTSTYLTFVASHTGCPVKSGSDSVFHTVAWNADNSYFVAGSVTGTNHDELTIYSFDGSLISEVTSLSTGASVSCVDWSWTNSFIAVGFESTSTLLRIYQFTAPSTLTEVTTYAGITGTVSSVDWNQDGTMIAAGIDVYPYYFSIFSFNPTAPELMLIKWDGSHPVTTSGRWAHEAKIVTEHIIISGTADGWDVCYTVCNYGLTFKDAAIQLTGEIYLNAPTYFEGVNVFDGSGYGLHLGSQGSIIVASGASLLLKDLTIYDVSGSNIGCVDSQSTLSFSNIVWLQDNDVTFTQGQLAIVGDLLMTGSSSFNYYSDQVSIIFDYARWKFDAGMTFNYQPTSSANNLIAFENERAKLHLVGTNLMAPATGLRLTKGSLIIEGQCPFVSDAIVEAGGIWLGDGSSANDLKIKILPESGIIAEQGYVLYKNVN